MNDANIGPERDLRPYPSLDELLARPPEPATEEMPAEVAALLAGDHGVYVRSPEQPRADFRYEEVSGAPGIWRLVGGDAGAALLGAVPGGDRSEPRRRAATPPHGHVAGYRPPWTTLTYVPPLTPFREGGRMFLEPRAQEEMNRLHYPFCTVGRVFGSGGGGTGVLVGPNLMLTAGHVAPWAPGPWHMQFIPAYHPGDAQPPLGSSFVEAFRGYNPQGVAGHDYVICKLYTPLGHALGWMGAQSWGDEDEYYGRRYTSHGYPRTFGGRPAVELDMGLRDIDDDSPGKELEFSMAGNPDIRHGWSGGPLWFWTPPPNPGPIVVGVCAGSEKDGLDPSFIVFAGGAAMVDLILFGHDHWRP